MSTNNFEIIMDGHSDKMLIDILKNRNDYQQEASACAIQESINRKIIDDWDDLQIKYPVFQEMKHVESENEINFRKEKAKKDMFYGALWCTAGIIVIKLDLGFVFWHALVIGGIQLYRGISNFE